MFYFHLSVKPDIPQPPVCSDLEGSSESGLHEAFLLSFPTRPASRIGLSSSHPSDVWRVDTRGATWEHEYGPHLSPKALEAPVELLVQLFLRKQSNQQVLLTAWLRTVKLQVASVFCPADILEVSRSSRKCLHAPVSSLKPADQRC